MKELQEETGYACEIIETKGWYYVWLSKTNQTIGKGFNSQSGRYRECNSPYSIER